MVGSTAEVGIGMVPALLRVRLDKESETAIDEPDEVSVQEVTVTSVSLVTVTVLEPIVSGPRVETSVLERELSILESAMGAVGIEYALVTKDGVGEDTIPDAVAVLLVNVAFSIPLDADGMEEPVATDVIGGDGIEGTDVTDGTDGTVRADGTTKDEVMLLVKVALSMPLETGGRIELMPEDTLLGADVACIKHEQAELIREVLF